MKHFHRRGAEGAEKGIKTEWGVAYFSFGGFQKKMEYYNIDLLFLCVLCASAVNNAAAMKKGMEF